MKTIFITFFVLFSLSFFGQNSDTLIIGLQIPGNSSYNCYSNTRGRFDRNLTKEDSLYNCRHTLTFYLTNNEKLFYQKQYNLMGTLVAEGPVFKQSRKKFMRKRTYIFYKHGIWKEYDYKEGIIRIKSHIADISSNEILTFEEIIETLEIE